MVNVYDLSASSLLTCDVSCGKPSRPNAVMRTPIADCRSVVINKDVVDLTYGDTRELQL